MLVHVDVRPPDRDGCDESYVFYTPLLLIAPLCLVAGGHPVDPRPLVRVIERICRAATDSVAKSS
jgi:hypothetical protein